MNILGYVRKKAFYPMTSLIFFMASLMVHIIRKSVLGDAFIYNAYADLIAVGVSIINLLIVDEIETRREIIKGVFENRYKKRK